jgi:hypothetical protein
MSLTWSLLAVPLLFGLNAFFVVVEYTLVAIHPAQIGLLRSGGRTAVADAVARHKAHPAGAVGAACGPGSGR